MTDKDSTGFIDRIKNLTDALVYISETDAPFEVHDLGGIDIPQVAELCEQLKLETASPVEELSLDQFFAKLTADRDWHTEEQKTRAGTYRELHDEIRRGMPASKVLRIGRIRIDILILGKTLEGNTIAIRTHAVET